MPKRPPCQGTRRDNSPCNTYAEANGYCRHHQDQAEFERDTTQPEPEPAAQNTEDVTPNALEHMDATTADLAAEPTERTYRDGRDALTSLATEEPGIIRDALKGVLTASSQGVKHDCHKCGARNTVYMPNGTAVVNAAKAILEEGLGKQQQEKHEPLREDAQTLLHQLDHMTDEDLTTLDDITLAAALTLNTHLSHGLRTELRTCARADR